MLHFDILDQERQQILPYLGNFKDDFYLAGGTALALQFGHRDSIDFDFFTEEDFSTVDLFNKLETIFEGSKILKVQEEANTLTIILNESIKVSFFKFAQPLVREIIESDYLRLASTIDVACMKASAITQRAAFKDYIDLYYILQEISLKDIRLAISQKIPSLDFNLVLKSLVYFEDMEEEQIIFKEGFEVSLECIKKDLETKVKSLYS